MNKKIAMTLRIGTASAADPAKIDWSKISTQKVALTDRNRLNTAVHSL